MKTLNKKIEAFLSNKKLCNHSGWSEVTESEINALEDIVGIIIKLKFETDSDGDLPVAFTLVNRTTHERLKYFPTRYTHKLTDKELYSEMVLRKINFKIACSDVDVFDHKVEQKLKQLNDPIA